MSWIHKMVDPNLVTGIDQQAPLQKERERPTAGTRTCWSRKAPLAVHRVRRR